MSHVNKREEWILIPNIHIAGTNSATERKYENWPEVSKLRMNISEVKPKCKGYQGSWWIQQSNEHTKKRLTLAF